MQSSILFIYDEESRIISGFKRFLRNKLFRQVIVKFFQFHGWVYVTLFNNSSHFVLLHVLPFKKREIEDLLYYIERNKYTKKTPKNGAISFGIELYLRVKGSESTESSYFCLFCELLCICLPIVVIGILFELIYHTFIFIFIV